MSRLGYVVICILVVITVALTVLLMRERRDVARLRENDRQRVALCLFYRGMVQDTRYELETKDPARDTFPGYLFYYWTFPAFLEACHVTEPTKTKVARRSWGCDGNDLRQNYVCLAGIARELQAAIPLSE